VRDLLTPAPSAPVTLRLRCAPCEVAWSGTVESSCWVCGGDGAPLNALLGRSGALLSFDADLLV
jgi:hypothetical protein